MKRLILIAIISLAITPVGLAAQVTANFIIGFDLESKVTAIPKGTDGQPVKADWVHLMAEKGNLVVVQIRAEKAIIDAMKADSASEKPTYRFIEDKSDDPLAVKEIQANPEVTKTFLTKAVPLDTLLKQDWSTPVKGVEAVVKCFDGKLADYKAGGLGQVTTLVKASGSLITKGINGGVR
ncbi:MAG: hypothetical protein WC749_02085 [Dehalococcoidia bacterium]